MWRKAVLFTCLVAALLGGAFVLKTLSDLQPIPEKLAPQAHELQKVQFLDRNGVVLSVTYQNPWNFHDFCPLHEMPPLLVEAFIESEDRRFTRHNGVDWLARMNGALKNVLARRVVRGASTITEQAVRMLHPRPRTLWSRWLEGIEAQQIERRFSKAQILEFYLNQVPYGHQRRGVNQAARFYFDRDLDSLNPGEILALVVLVRAPTRMDLWRSGDEVKRGVARLAAHLGRLGTMTDEQVQGVLEGRLSLAKPRLAVEAGHFVQFIQNQWGRAVPPGQRVRVFTTLDGELQTRIQRILDGRLADLCRAETVDGAVLVVDHLRDEILAWVNGGGFSDSLPGGWIDAVLVPRQPGSTLKPFLYSLALEKGWTPATLIEDTPLAGPVGSGLHTFHNFSRTHYGSLRLRDALGNSLNIPAVRAIQFTGQAPFLKKLHELEFHSLTKPAEHYGDGLALGDGEVSLFELVRAYTVLARQGETRPLKTNLHEEVQSHSPKVVFDRETASLIGDILSDPQARRLEFGDGHLLRFPLQTAVKTGTSSDHRDAWAVGFSQRYTAGVWIGNLERKPTRGITGASGPALVLRAVFAELNRGGEPGPFPDRSRLVSATICRISGSLAEPGCPTMREVFKPRQIPATPCRGHGSISVSDGPKGSIPGSGAALVQLVQPTPGLQLRMDPHIPDELEAFPFLVPRDSATERIEWSVDGEVAGVTGPGENRFLWKVTRGLHLARARVWKTGSHEPRQTPLVQFMVK